MNEEHRTPYAEDALSVENGTQPDEIQAFVQRRAKSPIEVDGVVVWNFNNHAVNTEVLRKQADDFINDEYVIPYQASGVWGYMVTLLPERIREAEILAYDQHRGQYNPYPCYIRHASDGENEAVRTTIEKWIEENL